MLADYDLDIVYHPGKAKQLAEALNMRKGQVSDAKDQQELVLMLLTLSLCDTMVEDDSIGLEAMDRADLLWKIREPHELDESLRSAVDNGVVG